MIAVKGKFDGITVTLDRTVQNVPECDVIVTFLDPSVPVRTADDGSLAYLFKDYIDDGIREPIIDFGGAVGNEKWQTAFFSRAILSSPVLTAAGDTNSRASIR